MAKKLKPQLADWEYSKLVDYADAYILKQLITEGGKGFHQAVWNMLNLAIEWEKIQKE